MIDLDQKSFQAHIDLPKLYKRKIRFTRRLIYLKRCKFKLYFKYIAVPIFYTLIEKVILLKRDSRSLFFF